MASDPWPGSFAMNAAMGALVRRTMPLSYDQFRFGFANPVDEDEAKELYETFAVPTPGKPLFQAAAANLNPWTEVKVDTRNPCQTAAMRSSSIRGGGRSPTPRSRSFIASADDPGSIRARSTCRSLRGPTPPSRFRSLGIDQKRNDPSPMTAWMHAVSTATGRA
jgi:hypothetical protein